MNKNIFFKGLLLLSISMVYLQCKKEFSCEGCAVSSNKAPTALAGNDTIIVLPLDSVLLDGSNSHDPDGSIAEYTWTKISGPSSFNIINSRFAIATLKNMVQGVYRFELKVTDNKGSSDRDTVMITVDAVPGINHPPVAVAGADQTITLPLNAVTVDGTGSFDPDNNITAYQWSKISGSSIFTISNANAVQTQITSLAQGVYQFELKVTDAGGLFSKDTIKITVLNSQGNNLNPVSVPGNDSLIQTSQATCTPVALTITLDGRQSYDPDGTIVSYRWSGPGNIANPDSAITTVTGLFLGVTYFTLKVTDNRGAEDTKSVAYTILNGNRPVINVTMPQIGALSRARREIAVAAAGNKILFAGGFGNEASNSWGDSRVDIYNISTNTWSISELSVARHGIAAVSAGNKIFFAGGWQSDYGDVDISELATVDIYDVTTNTWSVAQLSEPRGYISAVSVGNKVFFAGGSWIEGPWTYHASSAVDIYDISTNTWSVATLSEGRTGLSAVAANNKVFFAGGSNWSQNTGYNLLSRQLSDKIDICDLSTNSWSISNLLEPKEGMGGIGVNNKVYWAGGSSNGGLICKVEIRDAVNQSTSLDYLSRPADLTHAVFKDNKILFTNLREPFDVFNVNTNTWYVGILPRKRDQTAVICVNNTIYIAGGWSYEAQDNTNQVFKLEF